MSSIKYPETFGPDGYPPDYPHRKLIPDHKDIAIRSEDELQIDLKEPTRRALEEALIGYCQTHSVKCVAGCVGRVVFEGVVKTQYSHSPELRVHTRLTADDTGTLVGAEKYVNIMRGGEPRWMGFQELATSMRRRMSGE